MFSIMIRPTSIKAVKLTYVSISTFFLFIVSHILLSYCEGWFNGAVAITSAPHTEGSRVRTSLEPISFRYIL